MRQGGIVAPRSFSSCRSLRRLYTLPTTFTGLTVSLNMKVSLLFLYGTVSLLEIDYVGHVRIQGETDPSVCDDTKKNPYQAIFW